MWITHANLRHLVLETCDSMWRELGASSNMRWIKRNNSVKRRLSLVVALV